MTTEQAFEKLINIKYWYRAAGMKSTEGARIRSRHKKAEISVNVMKKHLMAVEANRCLHIISPNGSSFDNYQDAAIDMIQIPGIREILSLEYTYFSDLKRKIKSRDSSVNTATLHKHLEKAGYKIEEHWELPTFDKEATEKIAQTTKEAFERLVNTECWYRLVGVTANVATTIKRNFKKGITKQDGMVGYLKKAGAVRELVIVSPDEFVFNNYKIAFTELIQNTKNNETLDVFDGAYYRLKNKLEAGESIRDATMHKYLEKAGYTIRETWVLPPEIE